MLSVVKANLSGAWALIMNAAPADFRPAFRIEGKIKKKGGVPDLALERTPDILKAISRDKGGAILVGFAAEDADLEARAKEKLLSKGLDYIAANKAGGADDAFGSEEIALRLLSAEGWAKDIGPSSKFDAACRLISSLKCSHS
jgi:phosphopantothenoylcysteine decarboxylase/phosphopantothenate--cysteine ligase